MRPPALMSTWSKYKRKDLKLQREQRNMLPLTQTAVNVNNVKLLLYATLQLLKTK